MHPRHKKMILEMFHAKEEHQTVGEEVTRRIDLLEERILPAYGSFQELTPEHIALATLDMSQEEVLFGNKPKTAEAHQEPSVAKPAPFPTGKQKG